jgi:uronate dehydrogenase
MSRTLPARLLLTGAAGRIGTCLREGLRPRVEELRLTDRAPLEPVQNERFVLADLADRDAVVAAAEGMDAIVHLGAHSGEAAFDDLLGPNLVGTFNVFEAARRTRARRVVFASSNHATGFYPTSHMLRGDEPTRPDTLYGVTKVYGEALGRLYVEKFGLEVVCVRIGTFAQRPATTRQLATWLSPPDAVRLFASCLAAPDVGFTIVYGISANTRRHWDLEPARSLGYEPADDAEQYAGDVEEYVHPLQGGPYTEPGVGGWAT